MYGLRADPRVEDHVRGRLERRRQREGPVRRRDAQLHARAQPEAQARAEAREPAQRREVRADEDALHGGAPEPAANEDGRARLGALDASVSASCRERPRGLAARPPRGAVSFQSWKSAMAAPRAMPWFHSRICAAPAAACSSMSPTLLHASGTGGVRLTK